MESVKNKLQNTKKIINLFIDYFESLNPLLEGKYNEDANELNKILHTYAESCHKIVDSINDIIEANQRPHTDVKDYISKVFTTYHDYQNLYLSMDNVKHWLEEPYMQAENIDESNLSQTYKLETADKLTKLSINYYAFIRKYESADVELIEYLSSKLLDKFNILENTVELEHIIYIQSLFHNYKNTVSLYANFIQTLINNIQNDPSKHKLMYEILNMIELDKDEFISGNVQNKLSAKHKNIHIINPPLKRFGLIPVTDSMPLNNILNVIFAGQISGKISLQSYAKTNQVCFILMYRVVYNPIEYNIRSLILESDAQTYKQPDGYGITTKVVDRFRNIGLVGGSSTKQPAKSKVKTTGKTTSKTTSKGVSKTTSKGVSKSVSNATSKSVSKSVSNATSKSVSKNVSKNARWNFSYEIIGDHTSENTKKFYVLESLDGFTYRALVPWILPKGFGLPKYRVEMLLSYITSSNKPDRVVNYHHINTKKAVSNMFLRRPLALDILEQHSQEIDTQIIRNELYLKLTKLIKEDIIGKKYAKGQKINSNIDINIIIHDERIKDLFIKVLLSMYDVGSKLSFEQEFSSGLFPFYEILSTFIVSLRKLGNRFMKELHNAYNRNELPSSTFDSADKVTVIYKKLDEIITALLQMLIDDKTNIYSSMNYKYLLLNFH